MNSGFFLHVPSGGLANRMRAIASAYTLTQAVGSRLETVWFQDWALTCTFLWVERCKVLRPEFDVKSVIT